MMRSLLAALLLFATPVMAAEMAPIKIGGIFSYTGIPSYMIPAQHAAEMAVEEQNAKGGIHGRKVQLIIRDDKYQPQEAIKVTEELIGRDKVSVLLGESSTHLALPIVNVARRNNVPYFGAWCWDDKCIEENGKDVIFTLDEMTGDTLDDLSRYVVKQPEKRWALLVPNISYGLIVADVMEKQIAQMSKDTKIVEKQVYVDGKANYEGIIRAMQHKKVDGVITALYGNDFAEFLIAAKKLGFLDKTKFVNSYMPPENMDTMADNMPKNWYVLGYPQEELKAPAHLAFLKKFQDKYKMLPGLSGLITYIDTKFVLAALDKANSTEPQKIAAVARGLKIDTPIGPITLDAKTQRADMGYWYGYTDVKDGKPILRDFYRTGEKQP